MHANTVRVTVDFTPEQFALLDQAIGAIRQRLGTERSANALELITWAYPARVGEDAPAPRQQVVVHRCRICRNEWPESSKRSGGCCARPHRPSKSMIPTTPRSRRGDTESTLKGLPTWEVADSGTCRGATASSIASPTHGEGRCDTSPVDPGKAPFGAAGS